MWSNLNDSFSAAITGTISNIRQSIPAVIPFHDELDQQQTDSELRQLHTKLSLLSSEVARHRSIGVEYKNRWLKAESLVKQSSGHCSEVYEEIDLLSEQQPPAAPDPGAGPVELQHNDGDNGDEDQTSSSVDSSLHTVRDMALDSATSRIHRLEDELKKMDADRQHWRALAKQKSNLEDQLDHANSELSACADQLSQSKQRCAQLAATKDELATELQELDSQHELALEKVVGMRDELIHQNQTLQAEVELLKHTLANYSEQQKQPDQETGNRNVPSQTDDSVARCDRLIQTDDSLQADDNPQHRDEIAQLPDGRLGTTAVDAANQHDSDKLDEPTAAPLTFADLKLALHPLAAMAGLDTDSWCSTPADSEPSVTLNLWVECLRDALQDQIRLKQDSNDRLEETVRKLERYNSVLVEDKAQLESRLETMSAEHQFSQQKLLTENDNIRAEVRDLKAEKQTLQARLEETSEMLQNAQTNQNQDSNNIDGPSISGSILVRQEPEGATVEDNDNQHLGQLSLTDQQQVFVTSDDSASQSKLADLLIEHQQLMERFEYSSQELAELDSRHSQVQLSLDEANKQLSNQTALCDQLRVQLDQSKEDCHLVAQDKSLAEQEWRNRLGECQLKLEQCQQKLAQPCQSCVLLETRFADQSIQLTQQLDQKQSQIERLNSELERLRQHLVLVEDNYTGELVAAEEKCQQMRDQLLRLEQSTMAGQHFEEQIRNLTTQRDKARNEASMFEDKLQQYSTSISNLQAVIEQLDKEHERKLKLLEAEHRARLEAEQGVTSEVVRKLQGQEERLRETLEALEAASRLSETIDQKEGAINQLKRECNNKQLEIGAWQEKVAALEASYEGKVDKQIVKNMLISYFASGPDKRVEGERLLALFLDFNQQEMERSGIRVGRKQQSIGGGGGESFTSRFVQFLEHESSKPSESTAAGNGSERLSTGHTRIPYQHQQSSSTKVSTKPTLSSSTAELARDLNKRMSGSAVNPTGVSRTSLNPFVSSPSVGLTSSTSSVASYRSSRNSSSNSSVENWHPSADASGQSNVTISDIVSEAVDELSYI